MKKIFVLLQVMQIFQYTSAQNWAPIEIGNKWQYFNQIYYYNTPWPSLTIVVAAKDTVINNNLFYLLKSERQGYWPYIDSSFQRYDSENKMLYAYDISGNSEYVLMDFNLENGDTLVPTPYTDFFFRTIVTGTDYLFDSLIYYKGYKEYTLFYYGNYHLSKYTNDLGYYSDYSFHYVPGGIGEYDSDSHLIQSIIKLNDENQNHSHQNYPTINFSPVTSIKDSSLQLSFIVNHYYSRKYLPFGGNDSLLFNYIDSVFIESYYSNGMTTINNQPFLVMNILNEMEYNFNTMLDLNLLTNGYNYYYRIKAIDKGIIPHTTFSPVTNYYEVNYDTTTDVKNINNQLIDFNLDQNYPNPFNPNTSIQYAISSTQFVTLKVYDVLGKEVATLVNEEKPAGSYEIEFNSVETLHATSLPSGVYFYQLKAGNYIETKKMVLMK